MDNIVLVGMPGSGKSTVGVLLAKAMGLNFMDTDVVIQAQYGKKLQDMVNSYGVDAFLKMEEACVAELDVHRTVIATGGSVIYGEKAMNHLRENGLVVYLDLTYPQVEKRIMNLATRGVALREGQTLYDLYVERVPLYKAACDICFISPEGSIEQTLQALCAVLEKRQANEL